MPPRSKEGAAQALVAVAPLASRWIERLLGEQRSPLTVPQYLALRSIAREDLTAQELARRTGVSGPAVSQLLSGLADARLVDRRPAPDDRRRQSLSVTSKGARALAAADDLLTTRLGSLLEGLPKPEADALARALPRVEAALSGSAPPRRPPRPGPPPPRHPRPR